MLAGRHVAHMRDIRNAYRILVGIPEMRISLSRHMLIGGCIIKIGQRAGITQWNSAGLWAG
jgi:hypothetical protein